MSVSSERQLDSNFISLDDVKVDGELVQKLYEQSLESGSIFANLTQWDISKHIGRKPTMSSPATFQEMNNLWAGSGVLKEAEQDAIDKYSEYMEDRFSLKKSYLDLLERRNQRYGRLLKADISIPYDYLLIKKFIDKVFSEKRLNILEVGGGYGILAEEFLTNSNLSFCYTLVDGVPESICYQYEFLKKRFPEKKIGSIIHGDKFDSDEFDAFIMPAWEIEKNLTCKIDVAINIASIQEMPEETAEAYISFFERKLIKDGLIYFHNSRDFHYKREYEFPSNWKYFVKERTPRSRSFDYPLDILQKTSEEQYKNNYKFLRDYNLKLKHKYQRELSKQRKKFLRQIALIKKEQETKAAL